MDDRFRCRGSQGDGGADSTDRRTSALRIRAPGRRGDQGVGRCRRVGSAAERPAGCPSLYERPGDRAAECRDQQHGRSFGCLHIVERRGRQRRHRAWRLAGAGRVRRRRCGAGAGCGIRRLLSRTRCQWNRAAPRPVRECAVLGDSGQPADEATAGPCRSERPARTFHRLRQGAWAAARIPRRQPALWTPAGSRTRPLGDTRRDAETPGRLVARPPAVVAPARRAGAEPCQRRAAAGTARAGRERVRLPAAEAGRRIAGSG